MDKNMPVYVCMDRAPPHEPPDDLTQLCTRLDKIEDRLARLEQRCEAFEAWHADMGWGAPPMERYTAPVDTEAPDPNEPPPPPWEAR